MKVWFEHTGTKHFCNTVLCSQSCHGMWSEISAEGLVSHTGKKRFCNSIVWSNVLYIQYVQKVFKPMFLPFTNFCSKTISKMYKIVKLGTGL